MLAYVKSDIGIVRKTNEDNFIFLPPHLFAVADGMGGHVAGEIASKIAVTTINDYITDYTGTITHEMVIADAINEANKLIYHMSQSNNECAGMGTTVSALYIDENTIYWGHVGDSRIYLFHDNQFIQITSDHSLVWDLVRNGNITPEEALVHPRRNILTRAVGTNETIIIDTGRVAWNTGDAVLLCTDGLTNMVDVNDICKAMADRTTDGQVLLDTLIEKANAAGGVDNITVVLAQYGKE